ncbi:MAG: hypothetical protein L0H53_14760 [Candidatus Nitrosocosmicus sp.]|nr:hypothetical protein [Candidatus Nitrosocosmicus sp.]MDN5867873.1 hypothetical protein [Candidatus Nitrosocosmicus sp.]
MTLINKASFEKIHSSRQNANVKERMLLVLNVVYYGKIAVHVAKEIRKSNGLASQWLKRYKQEGLDESKDIPKGGRHSKISRQVGYRIKTILKKNNHG